MPVHLPCARVAYRRCAVLCLFSSFSCLASFAARLCCLFPSACRAFLVACPALHLVESASDLVSPRPLGFRRARKSKNGTSFLSLALQVNEHRAIAVDRSKAHWFHIKAGAPICPCDLAPRHQESFENGVRERLCRILVVAIDAVFQSLCSEELKLDKFNHQHRVHRRVMPADLPRSSTVGNYWIRK